MLNIGVFGGQGSFVPGMGKEQYTNNINYKNAIDIMSSLLNEDIPELCWGNKRTKVKNNPYFAHIALWASSYAVFKCREQEGIKFNYLTGHSLGEIYAYCLSGAFSKEDACKIIKLRGQLFLENRENSKTDMAAVIGSTENINKLKDFYKNSNSIFPANYNGEEQLVFSLAKNSCEEFLKKTKEFNIKRTVLLNIGNGCHSPFVEPINKKLNDLFCSLKINKPELPVLSCIDCLPADNSEKILTNLKKHLLSPVLWADMIKSISKLSEEITFYDLSFSNTVKGLIKSNCNHPIIGIKD